MEDGFSPKDEQLPPSRPAMNYPQLDFEPNARLLSTSQMPQPSRWYRPNIPANIASDVAELEAQYGIPPSNYQPQQTYYSSDQAVAQYGSCSTPTYTSQYGSSILGQMDHQRVRDHMIASGLARPPYSVPSLGPQSALFRWGMGGHDSRPNSSINAVQGTETLTPDSSLRADASTSQNYGESPGIITPSVEDQETEAVVHDLIPDTLPDCDKKRAALWKVMKAPWKINNEVEPDPALLLQFMQKNGDVWKCLLYNDGRPCVECSAKKRIQALEHMRLHIDLKPFACIGQPCRQSAEGCYRRYCSKDRLRKHRLEKVTCDLCGREYLDGNLQRHQTESCPGNRH